MITYSCEELHAEYTEVILDIRFPKSEIDTLKKQSTIVTHRVSDDAEKYHKGDYVYAEDIDENYCFEVVEQKYISKVEDSPYYRHITASQISYLRKFDRISVLTLKKTKYERPYKLSTIKERYPDKVYQKLVADRCHAWRARTGIEMIHLEPDDAEQKRTCKNWRLLPEKYRKASDKKSIELFGCDNESHEKMLVVDRIRKIFKGIHYGWRNTKTGKPYQTEEEFNGLSVEDVWRLGTPEQTIKAEVGNCYDTVAISFSMLKGSPVEAKFFFMYCEDTEFDGTHYSEGPTHTVCIYKNVFNGEWYWLEGSWGPFIRNDWHSKSYKELITLISKAMANAAKRPIVTNELTSYPKYGCDMTEFERFCRNGTKVGTYKPEKGTGK